MTGPKATHTALKVATTPPMISAGMIPDCDPSTPPMSEPTGMVPQTIVRIVAFILHFDYRDAYKPGRL